MSDDAVDLDFEIGEAFERLVEREFLERDVEFRDSRHRSGSVVLHLNPYIADWKPSFEEYALCISHAVSPNCWEGLAQNDEFLR